jgi:uncharacterized protein (TIGR02246 family)
MPVDDPDLRQLVADLATRVTTLEDELAITRLLTSYGFAVDGDDADACAALYAEDAVVTIDGRTELTGRDQVRGIVTSDGHQAILPGCAHVMGPFTVELAGDRAVATGYATVFVVTDGQRRVWRQSLGRWELSRTAGGWRVDRRESWARGEAQGQAMVRDTLRRLAVSRSAADPRRTP